MNEFSSVCDRLLRKYAFSHSQSERPQILRTGYANAGPKKCGKMCVCVEGGWGCGGVGGRGGGSGKLDDGWLGGGSAWIV